MSFNPATPATPVNFGAPPTPGPVYGDQPPATPGPVYGSGGSNSYNYPAPTTPGGGYGSNSGFRTPGSNQVAVKQMRPPDTPGDYQVPQTPRSAAEHGVGPPTLQNIVATVDLDCGKLDLKKIAMHARNAEYNPKRFAAVIMRIREPRTTALIFSSGKMVCTGAKSEKESRLAARKYARVIQKLGFPAKFKDFKIQNMVGSVDVKFPIRLEKLVLSHSQFSSYEPELFPGLIYRMVKPRIVLLIFVSENRHDLLDSFLNALPEEILRYCYEKVQILLSVDFVPRLPVETIDQIFGKLSANELLMASMTCKLWRKHALRAPLWAQLCKNRNWFRLEKILLRDLNPKQFESESKYRRLYYRANKLKHNWRAGESKNSMRIAHRHRVEALDHGNGITISGGRDHRIVIEHECSSDHQAVSIDTSSAINALQLWQNVIAAGCQDGTITLYNAATQAQLERYSFFDERPIDFVRITEKDKTLIATGGNRVKVINLKNGAQVFEQAMSDEQNTEIGSVTAIDGFCLITTWNGMIKVLNLRSFEWTELASENDESAVSSAIDKRTMRGVTGGSEGTVRGWNIINGSLLFVGRASDQDIYAVSCVNGHIATGCREGVIRLWSWTGQQLKIMKEHVGAIRCLQIHPNFDVLISAGDAKFLMIWDINSGTLLKRIHRNPISVNHMVVSPRHLILAGPADPGQLAVYDFQHVLTDQDKENETKYFS